MLASAFFSLPLFVFAALALGALALGLTVVGGKPVIEKTRMYKGKTFFPAGRDRPGEALDEDGNAVELPKDFSGRLLKLAGEQPEQTNNDGKTPLPDDFPFKSILEDAGIKDAETLAKVESHEDVEGLGEKRWRKVRDAMPGLTLNRQPQTGGDAKNPQELS